MIGDDMGALLWRRAYEARANLAPTVQLNEETLVALLRQAGISEPEDDVILWRGRAVHGRGLTPVSA